MRKIKKMRIKKNDEYNIDCKYIFKIPNDTDKTKEYKDNNILNNEFLEGLEYLI